jgi:FkbM family methyltransferase
MARFEPLRKLSPRRWYFRLRNEVRRRRGYEPAVTRTIRRVVEPGATCADVGAYVGEITRALRKAAGPTGTVFAFEAHPPTAARLREALAAEPDGARVVVENLAVTDGSAPTVTLFGGRGDLESEWNLGGHDVDGTATSPVAEVEATTLDDYFLGNPVQFVKIDVEGAEGLVLAGMRRILLEDGPTLVIEVHGEEQWRACERLRDVGYVLSDLRGRVAKPGDPRLYHMLATVH